MLLATNMHTAAKVMLILGGVTTVIGIIMFAMGAAGLDHDPMNDNLYEGKDGSFNGDGDTWFGVYTEASCDEASVSITDSLGDDMIFDWECGTDSELELTYLGGWYADDAHTYQISSNVNLAISDDGEYLGEAVGGFFAVVGSFGVLACGGCFLLLGGIFALTLKTQEQVVVVQQQGAPMMAPAAQMAPATQMAAPQYEQPQQYQQQPPQGGL